MKKEELFNIIGEVDEQKVATAGMAMTAKKKSRPVWHKWSVMAACLCLIVVAFFSPVLQDEHGGVDPQPGGTPGSSIVESQPSGTSVSSIVEPGKVNLLVVNEVESVMSADMDVQLTHYNKLPYDVWMSVLEDFHKLIGITYEEFTEKIPDAFECYNFYSLSTRGYKDANLENEYRLHDYVFEYQTERGGEATIAICSSEEPLRDYSIMCDNPRQSEINDVSVMIYGYQDTFMVQFSHENVNYDIETSNITLEELEDLLIAIMD